MKLNQTVVYLNTDYFVLKQRLLYMHYAVGLNTIYKTKTMSKPTVQNKLKFSVVF